MRKKSIRPEVQSTSNAKLQQASMALDDLVWTLQKIDVQELKSMAEVFRTSLEKNSSNSPVAQNYKSDNPNKHFLIGALPRLLQDKELFPQNEDIADFAINVLRLEMSRTEKRSRYEIIGKLICETDSLDDSKLESLVKALEKLVKDKDKIAQMIEKKRLGSFSWNETLQDLLNG